MMKLFRLLSHLGPSLSAASYVPRLIDRDTVPLSPRELDEDLKRADQGPDKDAAEEE